MCVCLCFSYSTHWLSAQGGFRTHPNSVKCVSMRRGASLLVPAPCCEMVTNALPSNTAWMCAQRPSLHFSFWFPLQASVFFSCASSFFGSGVDVCSQGQRSDRTGVLVPVLARTAPTASLPLSPLLLIWHGERTVCSIVLCVSEVLC